MVFKDAAYYVHMLVAFECAGVSKENGFARFPCENIL